VTFPGEATFPGATDKSSITVFTKRRAQPNALFFMATQGVYAQGINPLSADLYSKVVVPIALYGSELWSNMSATELNTISRFQHYAVKLIQELPTSTRSDMAESMLGLNRLPSQIESLKLICSYIKSYPWHRT